MDGIETYWIWIAIGLVLALLELVVPGVYLIWLALAALATGLLVFVGAPPMALQIISFVFLSLIFAYSARRFLSGFPAGKGDPLLNNRLAQMIGESAVVTVALDGGSGRVRVGDSEWIARGADAAVGARVRIIGHKDSQLLVEPETPLLGNGKPAG